MYIHVHRTCLYFFVHLYVVAYTGVIFGKLIRRRTLGVPTWSPLEQVRPQLHEI